MTAITPEAIQIEVLPAADEQEDVDTVVLASELTDELRQALAAQPGYVISAAPTGVRGDIIQLAGEVVQQAWSHQTELAALFGALITTLTALSKQRRIAEFEISRGDAKLVLKDIDRGAAERLLREFAGQAVRQSGPAKVTPRVSRRAKK